MSALSLFLSEDDVQRLLTMDDALAAVEAAFQDQGAGRAANVPRHRVRGGHTLLHTMSAALPAQGVMGLKAYTTTRQGAGFHVLLWDDSDGRLLAVIEADWLGRIRTGAVSGIATRRLARPAADTAGIFGTGRQAPAQLAALCAVRPLRKILAFSRRRPELLAFCRQMTAQLGVPVEAAPDPEYLVKNSAILVTITTAKEPVFDGNWLAPGTHINAAGANQWLKREVDDTTVARSRLVVVDDREQAQIEAGDLLWPLARGRLSWYGVHQLGDVVAGRVQRADADDITLFVSQGIALADVAVAAAVYRRAVAAKGGG